MFRSPRQQITNNNSKTTKKMKTKKMTKTDRAVERFAAMMIETIEGLEQGWKQTWLTSTASGRPIGN